MRDKTIDILRFIALIGIVVIHIKPSHGWVREMRSFDVPLMVFLSGVAFSLSQNRKKSYCKYVASRFVRLILPTWLFLCFCYFLRHFTGLFQDLPSYNNSFLLLTDWYIWIIRVLFSVAIVAPLVIPVIKRMGARMKVVTFLGGLFLNEILAITLCKGFGGADYRVMVLMVLPYLLVFLIGADIKCLSQKTVGIIGGACFTVFVAYSVFNVLSKGHFVSLQLYKYPPRFYWLAYGMACSLGLWCLRNPIKLVMDKCRLSGFASFIGSHTLWFYFWHILFLALEAKYLQAESALLRFVFVFFPSAVMVYFQSVIVQALVRKVSAPYGKTLSLVFNG